MRTKKVPMPTSTDHLVHHSTTHPTKGYQTKTVYHAKAPSLAPVLNPKKAK